jgi:multiple sugar transport system ATP-binding protein
MKDGRPHAALMTSEGNEALLPFSQDNMAEWEGKNILLGIRPEAITDPDGADRKSANVVALENRIVVTEPAGSDTFVTTTLGGKDVISRLRADVPVSAGEMFGFAVNMEKAVAFDPVSEERIKA